jgi:hypothetical protein
LNVSNNINATTIIRTMANTTKAVPARLVGDSEGVGRLEVYHDGEWGSVCEDGFDDVAATVVCHSIGFGYGEVISAGTNRPGNGLVWLDGVRCHGNEASILECSINGWDKRDCRRGQYVTIACHQKSLIVATAPDSTKVIDRKTDQSNPDTTTDKSTMIYWVTGGSIGFGLLIIIAVVVVRLITKSNERRRRLEAKQSLNANVIYSDISIRRRRFGPYEEISSDLIHPGTYEGNQVSPPYQGLEVQFQDTSQPPKVYTQLHVRALPTTAGESETKRYEGLETSSRDPPSKYEKLDSQLQ